MALKRDKGILTEEEIEEVLKEIIDEFCNLYKNKIEAMKRYLDIFQTCL